MEEPLSGWVPGYYPAAFPCPSFCTKISSNAIALLTASTYSGESGPGPVNSKNDKKMEPIAEVGSAEAENESEGNADKKCEGDQVRSVKGKEKMCDVSIENRLKRRYLAEEIGNDNERSHPPEDKYLPVTPNELESLEKNNTTKTTLEELQEQNQKLVEALTKAQKSQSTERKRFHEILFGIDKALSSLPVRLEKIRVRNQKNLSMIVASSKFHSGDGNDTPKSTPYESSSSSGESLEQVSSRMTNLLQKMDQLNEIIESIQDGDSSPVELLVNTELYAISLLKKEIRSTKKEIEKKETETATSTEEDEEEEEEEEEEKGESHREDSCSKAKSSFSNELNKARNFKIFENHMILQEEALNLLTRKIRETEEALLKEMEEKQGLRREKEAMAKEIFRLKSAGSESKGEKFQKTNKLKPELEAIAHRHYGLVKELKAKLEEKEKFLIAWKSKYSRLEAVNSNKQVLLDGEKKKNTELEAAVKNYKIQNKTLSTQVNSLQFINDQLKDQIEILKHQVEILANEKMERENESDTKKSKIEELTKKVKIQEGKMQVLEEEAESKMEEMKTCYTKTVEKFAEQIKQQQKRNKEFAQTFKELLFLVHNYGMEKEIFNIKSPSYNRIREILHITSSDLDLFFNVYAKSSAEREVQNLYEEFKSIVNKENHNFSQALSLWFFNIIETKLLLRNQRCS